MRKSKFIALMLSALMVTTPIQALAGESYSTGYSTGVNIGLTASGSSSSSSSNHSTSIGFNGGTNSSSGSSSSSSSNHSTSIGFNGGTSSSSGASSGISSGNSSSTSSGSSSSSSSNHSTSIGFNGGTSSSSGTSSGISGGNSSSTSSGTSSSQYVLQGIDGENYTVNANATSKANSTSSSAKIEYYGVNTTANSIKSSTFYGIAEILSKNGRTQMTLTTQTNTAYKDGSTATGTGYFIIESNYPVSSGNGSINAAYSNGGNATGSAALEVKNDRSYDGCLNIAFSSGANKGLGVGSTAPAGDDIDIFLSMIASIPAFETESSNSVVSPGVPNLKPGGIPVHELMEVEAIPVISNQKVKNVKAKRSGSKIVVTYSKTKIKKAKDIKYEVQVSTSKGFPLGSTTSVKTSSKKATIKAVKGNKISKKKTYYVRVRAIGTVKGTPVKTKWSAIKKVKKKK